QASDPAHVELAEREAAVVHVLGQLPGDQETRQYEEHVDAKIARTDAAEPGMVEHHQSDGDGTQAIQMWQITLLHGETRSRKAREDSTSGRGRQSCGVPRLVRGRICHIYYLT